MTKGGTSVFRRILLSLGLFGGLFLLVFFYEKRAESEFPRIIITDYENVKLYEMTRDGKKFRTSRAGAYLEIDDLNIRVRAVDIYLKKLRPYNGESWSTMQGVLDIGGYSPYHSDLIRVRKGVNRLTFDEHEAAAGLRIYFSESRASKVTIRRIVINPGTHANLKFFLIAGGIFTVISVLLCLFLEPGYGFLMNAGTAASLFAGYLALVRTQRDGVRPYFIIFTAFFMLFLFFMLYLKEGKQKDRFLLAMLLIMAFFFYFGWASMTALGEGPDEGMHYDVVNYVFRHGSLPRGDDPEIRSPIWGFSYSFSPILPFIIGAFFQRIAAVFTENEHTLLMAARMVSILSGVGSVFFTAKIADRVFPKRNIRYAFPVIMAFYPELAFMATYVNSDAFAIMTTVMIVWFWLRGAESGWSMKDCVGLSVSMGLCGLSYYNCYGYILMSIPFFFGVLAIRKKDRKTVVRVTSAVVLMTFAVCGWWFIRNAVLYDGDFLGRATLNATEELYALPEYKPSNSVTPSTEGLTLAQMVFEKGWLRDSFRTLIGAFSTLDLMVPTGVISLFKRFFFLGGAGVLAAIPLGAFRKKKDKKTERLKVLFNICLFAAMIIPVILSLIYSYSNDYQPQGRYLLPAMLPFAYFLSMGYDSVERLISGILAKTGFRGAKQLAKNGFSGAAVTIFIMTAMQYIALDTIYGFYY